MRKDWVARHLENYFKTFLDEQMKIGKPGVLSPEKQKPFSAVYCVKTEGCDTKACLICSVYQESQQAFYMLCCLIARMAGYCLLQQLRIIFIHHRTSSSNNKPSIEVNTCVTSNVLLETR